MNNWNSWPENKPKRNLTGQYCDMLIGPCCCGAYHINEDNSSTVDESEDEDAKQQ